MNLERDHGCFADLHWRLDVGREVDWTRVEGQLAGGIAVEDSPSFLRVWRADGGHQVVIVPRTGRIQIRLDPVVARDERAETARRLATKVWAIVEAA